MKFLLDVQLPRSALAPFHQGGHEASCVADIVSAGSKDIEIWRLAVHLGAVIVTRDEDFVSLQATQGQAVTVVWLRCGNILNQALVDLIDGRLAAIVEAIEGGARLIELR